MNEPFAPLRDMMNRGKTHLFLGDPMSNGIDKTVVEPGNAFSPGLWTMGVSLALLAGTQIIAPQTRDLPLSFDSHPPVTLCRYAEAGAKMESRLCHVGGPGWNGCDFFEAHVEGADDAALILTDVGPAGGELGEIVPMDDHTLAVRGGPTFTFETPVDVVIFPADAAHSSPCAFIHFQRELRVRVQHGYEGRAFPLRFEPCRLSVSEGFAEAQRRWRDTVPGRVYCPDWRVANMWEQSAFHILSAMECGQPRISVNNYPIFWIRDCVIVLRALDCIGRADLSRMGCDILRPLIFSGGFGCASDNPAEGLWCLSEHALLTGDARWAREILPDLQSRVDWICRMRKTKTPIYRPGDMRTVWAHWWPGSDIVCLPAERGHIHGRMDGHSPDFYINCWAYGGLRSASDAAELAGNRALAAEWHAMAEELRSLIDVDLLPAYGNERDSCAAPWPTGYIPEKAGALKEVFRQWYCRERLTQEGARRPEKLWTYFETAQIHNAMRLGLREEAWACLDGFLDDPRWMGMSLFTEGEWNATEMLPFGTGRYGKGWLQRGALGANMPHNWTGAEAIALIRDLFVRDDGAAPVLFSGVPQSWLFPGAEFGFERLPTRFGELTAHARVRTDGVVDVYFDNAEPKAWKMDLPKHR